MNMPRSSSDMVQGKAILRQEPGSARTASSLEMSYARHSRDDMASRGRSVRNAVLPWIGVLAIGVFLLLLPAIISGFPLMFPDSSDYIMLTPRMYRSPFYQIWVFATGFKISPWTTAVAQAIAVSWLLMTFLVVEAGISVRRAVIGLVALCVLSSLPVSTSFIMPDVFTGVMFVTLFLLVFRWEDLSLYRRVALFCLAIVSISVHLSHLLMATGIIAASAAIAFAGVGQGFARRGAATALLACGIAAAAGLAYNSVVYHRFALSPAGSTFLMANLIEEGPARAELQAICPDARYRLCAYRDRLPRTADEVLWDRGIVVQLGGFESISDESSRLVSATLAHRPLDVVTASLRSTIAALTTFDPTAEIVPTPEYVQKAVRLVYGPGADSAYRQSRQMTGRFPAAAYDMMVHAGLALAALSLVALLWCRKGRGGQFLLYAAASYVGNAFVCATLSGVHDRYQSRVGWLFVLAAVALSYELYRAFRAEPGAGVADGRSGAAS